MPKYIIADRMDGYTITKDGKIMSGEELISELSSASELHKKLKEAHPLHSSKLRVERGEADLREGIERLREGFTGWDKTAYTPEEIELAKHIADKLQQLLEK